MLEAARSIRKGIPMFFVRDMRATVQWYESIGFAIDDQHEDGGELVFAALSLGKAEFALSPGGDPGPRDVRFWFFTDDVKQLYEILKQRDVQFDEDLYSPFYGGLQFSIFDNNGLSLIFWQLAISPPASSPE